MKKIIVLMMMMLVASVSYGQVEDLFKRADEYNVRKAMQERIMRQKKDSCRLVERYKEVVQKFAYTLRKDGVDLTKLTDEDIDRLDSIRCDKKKYYRYGNKYYVSIDDEKLYTMPSEIFREEMKNETRYYAKIRKCNVLSWEDGTITCDADSTVYIDRGTYNIDGIIGHFRWVYEGDTIKIGRAKFVCLCLTSDMKVYDLSSGRCVGNGKEGVVNLKPGIYMYRGRKITVKRGRNEYYNTVFNGIDDKKDKVSKSKLNRRSNDDVYVMY